MIEFALDFNINKKSPIWRKVYNFKKVNWDAFSSTIEHTPWDTMMDESCIDTSLLNWMDSFFTIVDK